MRKYAELHMDEVRKRPFPASAGLLISLTRENLNLISQSWQLPTLTHLRDALPSAQVDLTAVFEMGTGVPQPL